MRAVSINEYFTRHATGKHDSSDMPPRRQRLAEACPIHIGLDTCIVLFQCISTKTSLLVFNCLFAATICSRLHHDVNVCNTSRLVYVCRPVLTVPGTTSSLYQLRICRHHRRIILYEYLSWLTWTSNNTCVTKATADADATSNDNNRQKALKEFKPPRRRMVAPPRNFQARRCT